MLVALVEEHGSDQLIEVGLVWSKLLDVEEPVVQLSWVLEELLVASWRVDDTWDDEDT